MSPAPVRGTQSFVGVMMEVWKRPSLTAIEICWRWTFGLIAGVIWWFTMGAAMWQKREAYVATTQATLHGGFVVGFDPLGFLHGAMLPVAFGVVWAAVSALGRDFLLRRIDGNLHSRRGTVALLAVMRVLAFSMLLIVWALVLGEAVNIAIVRAVAAHAYPSYVPGFAAVLFATLALFIAWCVMSWMFRLAPILAMARELGVFRSLRAACGSGALRPKLMEINLVMGIVKVALLVLAMVFSACPLPFSNNITQAYLDFWWGGVVVLWLLFSDYFHVVRAAAYLRLWRVYENSSQTADPGR